MFRSGSGVFDLLPVCTIPLLDEGLCWLIGLSSGIAMDVMSDLASRNLHRDALQNIFYAPMAFFDTTVR